MYISRNIVRVRWQNACTGVNPGFVSLRFTQFKGVPLKKEYRIISTELGMKVNIFLE